ncbi:DUF4270 domain-containing protein [Myroides sp. LJL116]
MSQKNIFKGLVLSLGFFALQSCDSDYTSAGSDIIGGGDYPVETYLVKDIKAYNQATGPVEANKLPEYSIGSLSDDFFGTVSNSLALDLSTDISAFTKLNNTAVFDSVYLYIPFYNALPEKLEEETYNYKLGSVYGDGSFNLKVYQNTYLISLDNPIAGGSIYFYNNDFGLFDNNNTGVVLNDSYKAVQNTHVEFSKAAINIYKYDKDGKIERDEEGKEIVKDRLSPGFWIDLNMSYFQKFFIDNQASLANSDLQKNAFRGLYLKASSNGSKGALGLLALGQGYLRATYEQEETKTDAEGTETKEKVRGEIKFSLANFAGSSSGSLAATSNNIISLTQSENDQSYQSKVENSNKDLGDDAIYLKGGEGSLGVIELFTEDDFSELKALRDMDILVNDAFLTVHVNRNIMENSINPPRLFLYNYDDSTVLADFASDSSNDKSSYGGEFIAVQEVDEENQDQEISKREVFTYRIRVREHIQYLLQSNIVRSPKLGLVVSNEFTKTVTEFKFMKIETPITNIPRDIATIPSFSITTPLGTVLHGTTNGVPEESKMQLEIFFTKIK